MKTLRAIKSVSLSETRWLAYATAGVAGTFGLSSSAEAEIHYSGIVNIKLTGNAQASLPLSNGASLEFRNIFGGSTFLQHFHFYVKGVISGSAPRVLSECQWITQLAIQSGSARERLCGRVFARYRKPWFWRLIHFLVGWRIFTHRWMATRFCWFPIQ